MTYRQVADYVKQRQRLRHRDMTAPEDDWFPEAFFLRGERLHHAPVPTEWFDDRRSKEELWARFAALIQVGHVQVFAFTLVMYMLTSEHPLGREMFDREARGDQPTAGMPRFQDIEGSIEGLHVHVFDAERHEDWMAQIKRAASGPPSLAPFELLGADADMSWGDMIDPIKVALR
jgi:hypothetical protein